MKFLWLIPLIGLTSCQRAYQRGYEEGFSVGSAETKNSRFDKEICESELAFCEGLLYTDKQMNARDFSREFNDRKRYTE